MTQKGSDLTPQASGNYPQRERTETGYALSHTFEGERTSLLFRLKFKSKLICSSHLAPARVLPLPERKGF